MSDNYDTSEDLDDIFKNLADEVDASERNRNSNRGGGRVYEQLKYVGMAEKVPRIIRALGANPDFNINNIRNPKTGQFDARIVQSAEALDDKGKRVKLVLPLQGQDENHILWRIINKVLESDWVKEKDAQGNEKNVRKYKHLTKYPNMVGQILYSNLLESNPARKFGLLGRGWSGRQFFMMNVIDRQSLDWHRENKHTVILSKSVNIKKTDDGKILEFADPGVPAFGFTQAITGSIMKFYGFWENYDIGVERTGLQTTPYRVFNASKSPEMILDKNLQKLVNMDKGLSDEEKSWERYDFDKLFHVTTATKLLNHFKNYLTIVDANLGTHFINELTKLSEAEKAEWEAKKEENEEDEDQAPVYAGVTAEAEKEIPVAKKAEVVEERPEVNMKFQLLGWDHLTKDEKAMIDSASKDGDNWSLKYKEGVRARSLCIKCDTKLPVSFNACPVCGSNQDVDSDPKF
jgi:hypothetical protein